MFKKALVTLALVPALLAGVTSMGATPAFAANGGVYIVTPKWWGWCPNIRGYQNRVVVVSITNTTTGYSQTDSGDDVGWTNVDLHSNNSVHVNVGCSLGIGSTGTVVTIRPTRNGQTFWTSPSGASYGN